MPCSYKPNNTKPGTIRGYDNVISVFLGCLGSAKHYTWNCLSSVRYPSTQASATAHPSYVGQARQALRLPID